MGENIVVKLGGASLFGGPSLLESMRRLVGKKPDRRIFVLVGGGETIESMRTLHSMYPGLDMAAMHWRCIRLLDATWEVACELFPESQGLYDWCELQQAIDGPLNTSYLVRTSAFYSPDAPHVPEAWQPAHDWKTTTDGLSWLLAKLVNASELWITKRCPVPSELSIQDAVTAGMVDSELGRLVSLNGQDPLPKIHFVQLDADPTD